MKLAYVTAFPGRRDSYQIPLALFSTPSVTCFSLSASTPKRLPWEEALFQFLECLSCLPLLEWNPPSGWFYRRFAFRSPSSLWLQSSKRV